MAKPAFQENIYSHFINQVKDNATFDTDLNGYVTSWNEGADRIKGYPESETIERNYCILFPDEARKEGKP